MRLTERRIQTRKDNFLVSRGPPFPLTKLVRLFYLEKNLRPLNQHISLLAALYSLLSISRFHVIVINPSLKSVLHD